MTDQFNDDELDNLLGSDDSPQEEVSEEHFAPMRDDKHDDKPARSERAAPDMGFFSSIPVNVTLEVASTEIPLKDLLEVDIDSVIAMDKVAGEPLDVKVNGTPFAKAEVVVMNGNYGLRIVELSGNGLNGNS